MAIFTVVIATGIKANSEAMIDLLIIKLQWVFYTHYFAEYNEHWIEAPIILVIRSMKYNKILQKNLDFIFEKPILMNEILTQICYRFLA